MFRSYLLNFALFLLPAGILLLLNAMYLVHTGEFLALSDVVRQQRLSSDFCLYGTALHDDTVAYKLEGYSQSQPKILVLGSSLTMQLRERMFTKPFYSMSSTVDTVQKAAVVTEELLKIHHPDVVLLGVDFWWFPAQVQPPQKNHLDVLPRFTAAKLFKPFMWLYEGKISVSEYIQTAFGKSTSCHIGIQAKEKRRGFARDGSYYYTSVIEGHDLEGVSPKFEEELTDIAHDEGHYLQDSEVNQKSVDQFVEMVRSLESAGVKVVVFFQPLSPTVYTELQKHPKEYAFIPKLFTAFRAAGVPFLNYLDPASIHTNDCEFVDGDHGGDITYARLLLALSSARPDIRKFIDVPELTQTIKHYTGLAMARDDRVTINPEIDFLNLGCKKPSVTP